MTSADIGTIPIKIKFRQINRILLDLSKMKTLIQKMKLRWEETYYFQLGIRY